MNKNKDNTSPTDAQNPYTQNQPNHPKKDTLENWLLADIQSITTTFQEMTKVYLTSSTYAEKEDMKRENSYLNVEKLREFLSDMQSKLPSLNAS